MRFCATYSDSHRCFLDKFFLKTFPFESGVTLILERMPQKCATGWLFADGWRDQMIEKQKLINKHLKTFFANEVLVFCDVDISFYDDVKEDLLECLGDNDIAFMRDHNSTIDLGGHIIDNFGRCGGFFILRSNDKTRELFGQVLSNLSSFNKSEVTTFQTSEQQTINSVLNSMPDLKWTYLPPRYYTHGLYTEGLKNFSVENQSGLWWENKDEEEKENVFIPDDMKVHHANWASGVEHKMSLLEFIYNKKRSVEDGK